jgi:hypothetical protein
VNTSFLVSTDDLDDDTLLSDHGSDLVNEPTVLENHGASSTKKQKLDHDSSATLLQCNDKTQEVSFHRSMLKIKTEKLYMTMENDWATLLEKLFPDEFDELYNMNAQSFLQWLGPNRMAPRLYEKWLRLERVKQELDNLYCPKITLRTGSKNDAEPECQDE